MKAVKLIVAFVVILGCVVVAFLWRPDNNVIDMELTDEEYEIYRQQFTDDWERMGDWNDSLFNSHCDLISQLSSEEHIQTAPLKNLNTSTAIELVHDKIFAEWESSTCRKSVIDRYMGAVDVIEKEDDLASENPTVKLIKRVNSTYREAYRLAYGEVGLSPGFNGENSSWNSFDRYRNNMIAKKDAVLGNEDYKTYLSNITAIERGLKSIPDKLSSARTRFYDALAREICDYYDEIPCDERTRVQLNQLRTVNRKYENEKGSSNSTLNSFISRFVNDVELNEERNVNDAR